MIPLIAGLLQGRRLPLAPVMGVLDRLAADGPGNVRADLRGDGRRLPRSPGPSPPIALGLGAGFATQLLMARGPTFADPPGAGAEGPPACGCGSKPVLRNAEVTWAFWKHDDRRATFGGGIPQRRPGFLFRWLTLAFMIESLMITYIPADVVAADAGRQRVVDRAGGPLWVGVPTYLNGYAAIPMVNGLLEMGMSLQAG